ncbi:MBL fold metallo-hydrolase [Staphylospora marina]|uniref:MBL fold metallo-hydrolase n=1 Tax=Staphylospora marina TaxID=2490858 RepID=UPI000F5B96C2|nr:MBL fold metallo-hydrolase [Staphylospora marina]
MLNRFDDIVQVALPLPFALKIINAWLIRGDRGYTVIDTGLHTEEDLATWEEVRKEIGFDWNEVEKIVLTHYHPDHYGLAGTLQQMTGAPVYMSALDWEQAQMFLGRESDMPELMADFFSKHGLEEEWASKIPGHLRSFHRWVEPHPTVRFLEAGDTVRLGNREYEVLHTPGHADGHLSFFDRERGWLIGGDFLLPKISPNISLWPRCNPDPLSTYLETLEKMKHLPVKKVFPSHGPVFDHYLERIEELKDHHARRLRMMDDIVRERGAVHAYDVCRSVFGAELSVHNLRFALSETLAHLEYLRRQGELDTREEDGVIHYTKR